MYKKYILVVILIGTFLLNGSVVLASNNVFTLDPIVVIASKVEENLLEVPVSVDTIGQKEIEAKNHQNVADLLKNLAGIDIHEQGGLAGLKTISIRGSVPEQVLIMIDGQPMNNSQNGQIDLGQLSTEYVKKIEVLKGPASALYGANALGGVVNIITKDSSKETAKVKLELGSYKTRKYSAFYSNDTENQGLIISAVKKQSDGIRENNGLNQLDFFTKYQQQLNKITNLTVSFHHNNSKKESPGSTDWLTPNASQDDLDNNLNLSWQQQRDQSDLDFSLYHNYHRLIYNDPDEFGYDGPSAHKTKRTGFRLEKTDYFKIHTLTYGIGYKEDRVNSNENGKHLMTNKSIFIQDKWEYRPELSLTLGTRFDNYDLYGTEISPRLGAVYFLNNNLNFNLSVSKAYRVPTFNDLYWPKSSWTEGNPDLQPEKAIAYETGVRYVSNNIRSGISYFMQDVDHLIRWAQGNDGIYRPYNVARATTKGIELSLTKELSTISTMHFNYTYLNSRDKDTLERLAPETAANLVLVIKDINGFEASVSGQITAGRPDNQDDYTVVNAKIGREINISNQIYELSLSINNLFDQQYQVNPGYPMPERNYTFEISHLF